MIKTKQPTQRHQDFHVAVVKAMMEFTDIPNIEHVALISQLLGQMIAMQDASKYTAGMIMDIVQKNLETGNKAGMETMMQAYTEQNRNLN